MPDLKNPESWSYAIDPKTGAETKYAVVCGEWSIAKYIVGGEIRFMLWKGKQPEGNIFMTGQEARDRADQLEREATQ